MRTPLLAVFEDTFNRCFNATLEVTLGRSARDEVIRVLEERGISSPLIADMFDGVVQVLQEVFGEGHRVIVHRTVVEVYRAYSQKVDFSYQDLLRNRVALLRNRVVSDHLSPKGSQADSLDAFFDQRNRPPANPSSL